MSLALGTRLGPYEVLGPLGEGGMGEVYRARDGRLARDVAVKVLGTAFADDPDRLRRFQQEARTVGALNHANVLSVFDFGIHDGAPYIVTELLEGETLRARLRGGALPLRKAIAIARDIAEGLDAAHSKGIVHRDLKPENIFLTRDGRAKVLDFGIAKLTHRDAEAGAPATESLTESGFLVGTIGYMAPEQVRGERVDPRTDLFALGCVLHEMLTGKRTFGGAGGVETLHAILHEEPPLLSDVRPDVPREVAVVAHHCLEKDPSFRFQSARDLAFALESFLGSASASGVRAAGDARARTAHRLRWITAIASSILLIAVAGLVALRPWRHTTPSFERLTFRRGSLSSARFSPDGGTILYSAAWDGLPTRVYSTRLDGHESSTLPLPDARLLAVSRNGDLALAIGPGATFAAGPHTTLATVPLSGGAPREIAEKTTEADWAPDGRDLAVAHWYTDRMTLEYPAGKVIWQATSGVLDPRVSPDGTRVAFIELDTRGDNGRGYVSIVDRSGRARRLTPLWENIDGMDWAPHGREIWFTATHRGNAKELWAVSLAGRQRLLLRTPGGVTLRDVSVNGDALISEDHFRISLTAMPPSGGRERDLSWQDATGVADISRDGRKVVFTEWSEAHEGRPVIGMRDSDGSPVISLGDGYAGGLSPDGKWVVGVNWSAKPHLSLLPTGVGQSRDLDPGPVTDLDWSCFSSDGSHVLFSGAESGHGVRTYEQSITGGPPQPITPEGVIGLWRMESPDGKYLMSHVGDSLFLAPIHGGASLPAAGVTADDISIGWLTDANTVLVSSPRNVLPVHVDRVNLSTGERHTVRDLMPSDPAGVTEIVQIVFTPDARAWAYSYRSYLSDLYLVRGLR